MPPTLSTLRRSDGSTSREKSNKTGTMKAPEASPADRAPPPTTPSPAPANDANDLTPSPPALTSDGNGRTPSPGGPARVPATPTTNTTNTNTNTTTFVHRCRRLATPSPATTNCSPFFANLYRTGSIFGTPRSAEPCEFFRRSPLKRLRVEPPDVRQWLTAIDLSEEPLFAEPPPMDPPMSPGRAAPFMPQSHRLKRSRDKNYARRNGDAISDSGFSEDSDDATVGSEMDYDDLDAVSDLEAPIGPPITENEEYYLNRDAVEPTNRSVKVLSPEEIDRLCGQPQDLADVLYHEIRRLIWAARGRPRMLRKISKLLSQSIAVIEMTKKVSHRLCFLERILEEHLPELDDDNTDSAMMNNLEARLKAVEEVHDGKERSRQNGQSSRPHSQENGESSRSQQIGETAQQMEQAVIAHEQVQVFLDEMVEEDEEDEEDEESDEEVDDENLSPEDRAEKAREKIRRGKAPVRPNGLL